MADIADGGGPAFPAVEQVYDDEGNYTLHYHEGMTPREYAAIRLRVPNSGADWLDEMIRQARRLDLAGQALAGLCSFGAYGNYDVAQQARKLADALIRECTTDGDAS